MVDKFTFYPKDWQSSKNVFQLTLEEKGLYIELIQLAYQTGNQVEENIPLWSRLFACSEDSLKKIIVRLSYLGLIAIKRNTNSNTISVPSVSKRLSKSEKARASVNVRWKAKRNTKRNTKKESIKIIKENEKEKIKTADTDVLISVKKCSENYQSDSRLTGVIRDRLKLSQSELLKYLKDFEDHLALSGVFVKEYSDFRIHFRRWLELKVKAKEDKDKLRPLKRINF